MQQQQATPICAYFQYACRGLQYPFKSRNILFCKLCFCNAAVILKRSDCCNNHNTRRLKTLQSDTLYQKIFSTEVGTKARFGYAIISKLKSELGGANRVATVCNIRKRTAVHTAGSVFKCLNKDFLALLRREAGEP